MLKYLNNPHNHIYNNNNHNNVNNITHLIWKRESVVSSSSLSNDYHTGSHLSFVRRLNIYKTLDAHKGCVNTIKWSPEGRFLVSGSDDLRLVIWDAEQDYKPVHDIRTGHCRNIFSAEFMPYYPSVVVSGAADGEVRVTDINAPEKEKLLLTSSQMVLKLAIQPSERSVFLAALQEGLLVRFDLRMPASPSSQFSMTSNTLVDLSSKRISVNTISFNPNDHTKYAIACGDPYIRLYDIRSHKCIQQFAPAEVISNPKRNGPLDSRTNVSGLQFNNKNQIVASYCSRDVYLFDMPSAFAGDTWTQVTQVYKGHRNVRTFLKEVSFMGHDAEYVLSGSDCGHLFVWNTKDGNVEQLIKADSHVLNGIATHPSLPTVVATCGIDSTCKIIYPNALTPTFSVPKAHRAVEKNIDYVESETTMSMRGLVEIIRNSRQARGQLGTDEDDEMWNPHWPPDALRVAEALRQEGNELFKENNFQRASFMYQKAIECLESTTPTTSRQEEKVNASLLPCLLNRAACAVRLNEYHTAISDCTKVLTKYDPNNVKALFRRGVALFKIFDYDKALEDCQKAAILTPADNQIKKQIAEIKAAMENAHKKETQMFKNMFK